MKKQKMKITMKTLGIALSVIALNTVSYGQKKNETSAAVEFKNKYQMAVATGDFETAKKSLISAKEFVDLAAEHVDTKDSQKTMWLKGEIYANFMILGMQTQDTSFMKIGGEDAIDQSISAFKHGFTLGKKYQADIQNSVYQKAAMMNGMASMLYKAEQYPAAAEVYETIAKYSDAVNELDSVSIYNASLCYEKSEMHEKAAVGYEKLAAVNYKGTSSAVAASRAYRNAGNVAKAKEIINSAREKNGTDRELLLELVNTNIEAGDAAGAEKALNDAIATDPNNKQLYYTIGTIYIDLKDNAKAEESLNKALSIDPDYIDAQYQLGAHLVTWAGDLKTEANDLKFGDPNYNKLLQQSEDTYKRAMIPLEKYIVAFPDDKAVLNILFQLHRNLGNSEKAIEYKKRAEGIE